MPTYQTPKPTQDLLTALGDLLRTYAEPSVMADVGPGERAPSTGARIKQAVLKMGAKGAGKALGLMGLEERPTPEGFASQMPGPSAVGAAISRRSLERIRRQAAQRFYDRLVDSGEAGLRKVQQEWPGPADIPYDELVPANPRTSMDWRQVSPETRNLLRQLQREDWLGFDSPAQAVQAAFDRSMLPDVYGAITPTDVQNSVMDVYPSTLRRVMNRVMRKAIGKR